MKLLTSITLSNIVVVFLTALSFLPTTKAYSQNELWCMEFQNSLTGLTIGDSGTINRTTDGGSTWIFEKTATNSSLRKSGLLTNDDIVVVGFGGTIIKTTNNGDLWSMKSAGITTDFYSVDFGGRSSETGIAVGDKGTIIRTTDLGETWTVIASVPSAKSLIYTAVSFESASKGIIVGQKGTILITTDGGLTWFHVTTNVPYVDYKFVIMLSDEIAYATGDNGTIIKTTDGGSSWISLITNSSSSLTRIRFSDDLNAISVGSGGEVIKTTDGGLTWTTENSGTANNLNCLYVSDENTAFAGGQDGIILKTTDGGISWVSPLLVTSAKGTNKNANLQLFPGYPNPTNPVATLKYFIGASSIVTLKVYDATGSEVSTLVSQSLGAGYYSALFDGSRLASGIYYCKLVAVSVAGTFSQTTKIVLVK